MEELLTVLDLRNRPGPPTQFQSWHLLAAFLTFSQTESPIGRYELGAQLALGGGSVRSLVKHLRTRGVIQPVSRRGHGLSRKGSRLRDTLEQVLVKLAAVPQSAFTLDRANVACHLRQRASQVTDGVRQRDAALQAGATGATTLVQGADSNLITMPSAHHIPRAEAAAILEPFKLLEGDVLVIGSGSSERAARLGAIAAALTLLAT